MVRRPTRPLALVSIADSPDIKLHQHRFTPLSKNPRTHPVITAKMESVRGRRSTFARVRASVASPHFLVHTKDCAGQEVISLPDRAKLFFPGD
ncbi:hypothetical protein JZ751_014352 [Albula glossodonta]|uniref:Uncharacterized protein n=1 Tax=Albula glossodonta TaxID=121402 RepID=A0A8T2NWB5_9TELE|nr:hypothetical protein JZ751_014352 [Albula glossodonta]